MYVTKINYISRIKDNKAKSKIINLIGLIGLGVNDIRQIKTIIHCDNSRRSYKVDLKNENFTVFDDGTILI